MFIRSLSDSRLASSGARLFRHEAGLHAASRSHSRTAARAVGGLNGTQRVRAAITGILFIIAGVLHFIRPGMYEQIVPPQLGHAPELVAISGVAEIAGGLGLIIARTRGAAGLGLIALLVAVWPANIYMAIDAGRFAAVAPAWVLWARVPLQIAIIWWVQRVSR
jgi:uncharacterized membrane protein